MTDIGTFTKDIRGFLGDPLDRFAANKQKAQDDYSQPVRLGSYIQGQLTNPLDRLSQVRSGLPGGGAWGQGAQGTIPTLDWLTQHGTPYRNPYNVPKNPLDPQGFGFFAGQGSQGSGTKSNPLAGGPSTALEPDVNKWAGLTVQTFGDIVDPDIMLAIMQNESHGNPNAHNPGGASGLFQLLPGSWTASEDPFNPNDQMAAAKRLAQQKLDLVNKAYAANGLNPDARTRALDFAAAWGGHFDYDSGKFNPNSYDPGVNQTGAQWAQVFLGNYDNIKASRQQGAVGSPGAGGSTGGLGGVTPGAGGQIMQEFGVTDTSNGYLAAGNHVYDYGSAYGMAGGGHPGVDWAVPRGTQVATPLGGTVSVVGNDHGTGYFYQDTGNGDRDHSGEFAITLSNGDILILGHLSRINVNVGDQVNAGALIGASGGSDGDHVHVEYRQKQADGSYRVIDPRTVLGQPAGGGGAGYR